MNPVAFIAILFVFVVPFSHEAHALAVSHLEVVIPDAAIHASWWAKMASYIGIRNRVQIRPKVGTVLRVVSSAYASSPYQTDSTPCITASGTTVRPGVVAANFLPFGTIISIDGNEYTVEDRMNSRYSGYYLDIWFPSTSEALEFGRKKLDITIVSYDETGSTSASAPSPKALKTIEVPDVQDEGKKTLWETVSNPASELMRLLLTKTYNDPNKYDVDCSK